MEIRLAKKKDLPDILKLCKQHAKYEKVNNIDENKEELLLEFLFGKTSNVECLVIEHKSFIKGYATYMKQFSTWNVGCYIYIDCLFLKESIRGKGIGTLTMQRIKAYAKKEKCKVIEWQTPIFNKKAIEFYKKIGGVSKTKERFKLEI